MHLRRQNYLTGTASLLLLLFIFMGAHLRTTYAATDDYLHYWTFDEGIGRTVSDARGGKNGIMTGTSTGFGWASGKIGNALGIDGASSLAIVLPEGMLSGSQGSISLWFKIDEMADRNVLFSGTAVSDKYLYALLGIDREGRPQFQFRTETNSTDRKVQGATILNRNEWYHLVFTADTQRYRMFVNGEELTLYGETIGRWFSDLTNHIFAYRIGASEAYPLSGSFSGYIDDVRIYGRALSTQEVVLLYEEGNVGEPTVPGISTTPSPAPALPVVEVPIGIPPVVTLNPAVAPTSLATAPSGIANTTLSPERRIEILSKIHELLQRIILLQTELNLLTASGH